MKRVFLGGTCNDSDWRDYVINNLTLDYFNPVVKDWTPECQDEEIRQRQSCDFVLYMITPRMTGVYSIAEVVDDSNKRPEKTIFCWTNIDTTDKDEPVTFNKHQEKSLEMVGKMVEENGAKYFRSLPEVVSYLNQFA